MTQELNTVTIFYEQIGNMNYEVAVHFFENSRQTVRDRLKRVILHEFSSKKNS